MCLSGVVVFFLPQVVAIPLRNYAAVRAVDTLLIEAGFKTTFHYTVPKVCIRICYNINERVSKKVERSNKGVPTNARSNTILCDFTYFLFYFIFSRYFFGLGETISSMVCTIHMGVIQQLNK